MNAREQCENQSEQPLSVVPDANVLIHGKALIDIPWAELGFSEVEILFVPPMVRELDKLKVQTGRQNKLARQLSSDIRKLLTAPDRRIKVRQNNPTVSKRLELRPVTESFHPALQLDHADQALINYALWLQQQGNNVLLLTDDTICGTTSREVGLPVHFLPEEWLRQPEPDESAKENTRLKAEIQRLAAAEPKVELNFCDSADTPLTELRVGLTRWPALSDVEIEELMAEVKRLCPKATSFERAQPRATDIGNRHLERASQLHSFIARSVYEPATEKEIDHYNTVEYPEWLESVRSVLVSLHHTLEAQIKWPNVVAVAANLGTRPATETLLTIKGRGAITLLNVDDIDEEDLAGDAKYFKLPPTPPRGRTKTISPFGTYGDLNANTYGTVSPLPFDVSCISPAKPKESDAFYWRTGQFDWSDTIELECASWRHGQDPLHFALRVRPETQEKTSAAIEIRVHAYNISKPQVMRLPVCFDFEDGSTFAEGRARVDKLGRSAIRTGRL